MSATTTVLFVHGMGGAEAGFSDQAWSFLQQQYARLRPGETLQGDRIEFLYDSVFNEFRAGPKDALAQLAPLTSGDGLRAFVQDLQQSDQFAYTHVLDVLLWRFHSHVRSVITTDLAAKLVPYLKILAGNAEANLVLIAHSLGTSVMHEVLNCVAGTGATKYVAVPAIHMLANVSKVLERPELQAYNPPSPSLCRPIMDAAADPGAAVQHYFTYWNKLDPIPQVDRFKPSWPDSVYHDIGFTALGQGVNPHDLNTYVQAPEVYMRLLRSISLDPGLTKDMETDEIYKARAPMALTDSARKAILDRVLSNFEHTSDLGSLLKLMRIFKSSGF